MTRSVRAFIVCALALVGVVLQPACAPAGDRFETATTRLRPSSAKGAVAPDAFDLTVVFVVDVSRNLSTAERVLLSQELTVAVDGLDAAAGFNVIAFGDATRPLFENRLGRVNRENGDRIAKFLNRTSGGGVADPLPALRAAFELSPDVIFFLVAGSLSGDDDEFLRVVADLNRDDQTMVNTIQYLDRDRATENLLQALAASNGGEFRHIDASDLAQH